MDHQAEEGHPVVLLRHPEGKAAAALLVAEDRLFEEGRLGLVGQEAGPEACSLTGSDPEVRSGLAFLRDPQPVKRH